MSSEPAPTSSAPTAPRGENAVVDFFAANRATIAWVMIALGVLCFGVGVYSVSRVVSASVAADTDKDKPEASLADSKKDLSGLNRTEQILSAIGGLMLAVVFVGIGLNVLMALPKLSVEDRRTDARQTILLFGGLLGLVMMVITLTFFIAWFGILVKWIDDKVAPPGTYRVVLTILVFLVGAGIAFLAAQPARADERNNPLIRRLIFGGNLVLSVLLLVVVLVIANILIGLKVTNKLDTTESGVHTLTLNDATKEYLGNLTTPMKIYSTFPESEQQIVADTRRLFTALREQNPQMITIEYLSPTLNRDKLTELRNKYPQATELADYGILVTAGEDEKQYAVIRPEELIEQKQDRSAPGGRVQFVGEAKVIKEMLFLSENKTRPVVYFTSGHGELEVIANPMAPAKPAAKRGGNTLQKALEKAFVDVRPLELDLANPKVPTDASIVAIADPRAAFSTKEVDAIRKYLSEPQANGKKGKLILMSSPTPKADGTGVVDLGLSNLLAEYGVSLGNEYLLNGPYQNLGYTEVQAIVNTKLIESRNPIALEFAPPRGLLFANCREVVPATQPPGGPFTAEVLFATYPPSRVTWYESDSPANPGKVAEDLFQNDDLARSRRASNRRSRAVAVLVSEGANGKMAVFGSGEAFADSERRGAPIAEVNAELFTLTVNWLRERPPVWSVANKTYGVYNLGKGADNARLIVLPALASSLGVLALGIGVWMFRRK